MSCQMWLHETENLRKFPDIKADYTIPSPVSKTLFNKQSLKAPPLGGDLAVSKQLEVRKVIATGNERNKRYYPLI